MRDERGFTLTEMLVAMSIMGIISAALMASVVIGLRTTDDTRQRITDARDAQIISSYFMADAQSAEEVALTDADCAGQTPVVRFRWMDQGVQMDAVYVARAVGSETRMTRYVCEDGGAAVTNDVGHGLSDSVDPSVTCPGGCAGTPARITLDVTEADGFSFSVSATRRPA